MESEDAGFPKGSPCRVKINLYCCVVCGTVRTEGKGYLFYQSGRTRLGAPFCAEHAVHFHEYANPVFENLPALELFKEMFPKTYWQDVAGKHILYFNTYSRKEAIAYQQRRKQKRAR